MDIHQEGLVVHGVRLEPVSTERVRNANLMQREMGLETGVPATETRFQPRTNSNRIIF